MGFVNLIKKIIKRIIHVFYINPKRKLIRRLSYRSIHIDPSFMILSSEPYISGDSFRKFADHIFDETSSIKPGEVKDNDVVFLNTGLKNIYFSEYHNLINSKYILLTHNSDESINKEDLKYLDEKIIHWFAMKLNIRMNDKLTPLPAGLENKRYFANGIISNFEKVERSNKLDKKFKKIDKIFCSFNEMTNIDERKPLLNIVQNRDDVYIKRFSNNIEYLTNLSLYKYNLCPEGNDFESHRMWETLFYENTPIVKKNNVNLNFVELGVPLIVLEDWNDINSLNTQSLEKNFLNNDSEDHKKFVYFKFWEDLINQKKI